MEIKKFIFVPDGHYGYPESTDGDTPYDYNTLVEEYCGSGYSAWNQGDFDVDEEPDEDDYETSEEYDENLNYIIIINNEYSNIHKLRKTILTWIHRPCSEEKRNIWMYCRRY